jgi:hypothetical protein
MFYVLGNRVQHTRAALGKQEGKRRDWNFVKGMWARKHCSAWQVLGGWSATGSWSETALAENASDFGRTVTSHKRTSRSLRPLHTEVWGVNQDLALRSATNAPKDEGNSCHQALLRIFGRGRGEAFLQHDSELFVHCAKRKLPLLERLEV